MATSFIESNILFFVKDILPSTLSTGATFRISDDIELGQAIETGAFDAFIVFKNQVQIERMLVSMTGGIATIVKRGLEQDGITENSLLKKDWNDGTIGYISVKPDDFIATDKLDRIGGLRVDMGTAQNIGATNASTAITVADTTGWTNGASITGTGIAGGTTIVSFVPNTSAVLSANFTGTTGTVSVVVGRRQVTEINANNNEVKFVVANGTSISSSETIRKRKADGTYEEVPFSFLEAAVASLAGGSATFSLYDTGIVSGDAVGDVNGFLTKCATELASSINLNAGTIVAPSQVALDATRILFTYSLTNVVKAVVGTISGNTISLGTVVDIYTGAAINDISTALIGTDKVVIAYGESTAGALIRTKVVTIAGTTITQGAEYSQTLNNGYSGNYTLGDLEVIRLRTDVFVWNVGNNSGGRNYVRAFTVSGTTITAGTVYADYIPTGAGSWVTGRSQMAYLSENKIAFYCLGGTLATAGPTAAGIYIWTINPANTTISATNTYNPAVANNAYLARYDDNTVLSSFEGTNTNVFIYGISVTGAILFDNGATKFLPLVPIISGVFATYDVGTLKIYQYQTLIRTIATAINLTTAPTKVWHVNSYFQIVSGRMTYVSGNNGTTRFVNLGITLYLGLASNATGGVIFRGLQARTTPNGAKYYVQTDGSIGLVNTGVYVGKGLGTSIIIG